MGYRTVPAPIVDIGHPTDQVSTLTHAFLTKVTVSSKQAQLGVDKQSISPLRLGLSRWSGAVGAIHDAMPSAVP